MRGTILVVDDDEDTASMLAAILRERDFEVTCASSARACLDHLAHTNVDVVVTDLRMSGMSGIELCGELRDRHPDLLALVITGVGTLDLAVSAMRANAYDYLAKPVNVDELEVAIVRALAHRPEVHRIPEAAGAGTPLDGIDGDSSVMREMVARIRAVADSDATVLVSGESGTGKELVARAVHRLSRRRHGPFVAINCAAVPASLLESELFGHLRGAFTDATHTRPGLFVQAGAGTIFLDELGETPIDMQVKLLRVLQERTVRPVGGDVEVPFEARVIASTNRDLAVEVLHKRFREDLFYRINVVEIAVPPLRERGRDVLVLAHHFLQQIARRIAQPVHAIAGPAAKLLMDYDWPGNVRELENSMERAVVLCRHDPITVADLPAKLRQHQRSRLLLADLPMTGLISLDEMEHRYVRQVVAALGGNQSAAARVLGIDRRSVYRRLHAPDDNAVKSRG